MNDETNEQEQLAVDVGDFVETLIERQDAYEASVNTRLDAIDERIAEIFVALREATATIKALIDGRTSWRRPSAGNAVSN